ncbi:MAG: MBL fold metallo-hydrolase [Chloroflexota bacterium]|nr:MBL fold metallo-hydrolase [Chloroflexota bacterium]
MAAENASAYVASRRFGDATVTVIADGSSLWPQNFAVPSAELRAAIPELDAAGRLRIGFHAVHIRIGSASILIDAGFDDLDSTWGRKFATMWEETQRTPGVEAGLASIGVRPEEVTHVITTHAHFDHYVGLTIERDGGYIPRFPNARHLIGQADRVASRYDGLPDAEFISRIEAIERRGLLDLVDGDREVVPGVTMLHAPGESPGHAIVHVASQGEHFYALGDLLHHPCEVAHLDWVLANRDQPAMRASRDRLVAAAVPQGATLVFSHAMFPPWGRIVPDGDGFRWEEEGQR